MEELGEHCEGTAQEKKSKLKYAVGVTNQSS